MKINSLQGFYPTKCPPRPNFSWCKCGANQTVTDCHQLKIRAAREKSIYPEKWLVVRMKRMFCLTNPEI